MQNISGFKTIDKRLAICTVYHEYQFYFISKMIKNKYHVVQTLKESPSKQTQLAVEYGSNRILTLKSCLASNPDPLQSELNLYQMLKEPHVHGFPELKEGFQWEGRLYLAYQQLGEDIERLRKKCGGRLGLKSVLMISLQILERIQHIHKKKYLHGDIKPSNFLVGVGTKLKHKIYLVDFQLSHAYMINGKHIDEKVLDSFTGNLRFSSPWSNSNKNVSRRDELYSLLYSMIFLLKGELPWMNIVAQNLPQAYALTSALKQGKKAELLQGLPSMFDRLLTYIEQIKFKEQPNYGYIRKEMLSLMKKNGYEFDYKYDWEYL